MNVDNISDNVIPDDFSALDRLDWIFKRQHQLSEKYMPIEKKNGLRHTMECPVTLDDRYGQAQLKDMFWRVTEELTEAVDAQRIHAHLENHCREELADALHFLTEALILAGVGSRRLIREIYGDEPPDGDKLDALFPDQSLVGMRLERYVYEVIHQIGCASNCLKQRPWKCTHQLVDAPKFRSHLVKSYPALMCCFQLVGMSSEGVFRMYFRKSEVNKFRIRSNY